MTSAPFVRDVSVLEESAIVYSFASLVTDLAEYRAMVAAFCEKGFGEPDCEWLYVDNSAGNRLDAFEAYNRFLLEARGRYVILCHQDILPLHDNRAKLDRLIAELTARDPQWGICGNAGGLPTGQVAFRITQGNLQELNYGGPFPQRAVSLDENFMIARRDANLALSSNLKGFHWYGTDICLIADVLGWNAYVIDFHLFHKSTGRVNDAFRSGGVELRKKYQRAFRARWQYVPTFQHVFISGSSIQVLFARVVRKLRYSLGM